MKANKFAFMLYQKKTPKTTILLLYILLEWALIALLLTNGLLHYFIDRFASFFGLQPPCVFCSRVDHMFGLQKSYKDLMCDAHGKDVSKYGFCLNHRNLARASEINEDYASSRPLEMNVLTWMKRIERGEKDLRCSCCNVMLESRFCLPSLIAGNEFDTVKEAKDREINDEKEKFVEVDIQKARKFEVNDESLIQMENCVLSYEERLVPIELVDNATLIRKNKGNEDNIYKDKEKLVSKELIDSLEETISNNFMVDQGDDRGNLGYNVKQTCTNSNIHNIEEAAAKLALFPTDQPFKFQTLEHKEECGTESLDGSIASEIDGNELTTMEHFKAVLSALYIELEEERNASAIAANQTMAMITRLQEEKAAVQMEALHYRRVMDEQYEFDQETLQLLNELMYKRENENRELENELEVYRKMVQMEDMKINGSRSQTSFDSSSNEESDDLSFEICEREEMAYIDNPCAIDVSFDYFEEESLSILDQLKALEDTLFIVDDEFKCTGHERCLGENGHGSDSNGKPHHQESVMILPLFDAKINTKSENEVILSYKQANKPPETQSKSVFDDKRRLEIAKEVDNIYERLQVLEENREFLKHCIKSSKKGEKGTDLLQEVLRHFYDLRCVGLRTRNARNELASLST